MRSFASLVQKARDLSLFTIGTIGTCITYVITVVLIKIAPHTSYRKDRSDRFTEDDVPAPDLPAHGDRTIRFAIFLYKKSWIRSSLIRSRRFRCRFVPSCSDYAVLAVRKYGLARGLLLIGDRFRRCGPSDEGDYVDFP